MQSHFDDLCLAWIIVGGDGGFYRKHGYYNKQGKVRMIETRKLMLLPDNRSTARVGSVLSEQAGSLHISLARAHASHCTRVLRIQSCHGILAYDDSLVTHACFVAMQICS